MLHFDEKQLCRRMQDLTRPHRAAFAAACAERLLLSYDRFSKRTGKGDYQSLVSVLEDLWEDLISDTTAKKDIDTIIGICMSLIPSEDEGRWVNEQACAEDSVSAVAYALRCFRTGEPQEAAWAARRAYECLDHYVVNSENIDTSDSAGEARALSHPLVQAELGRQQRDLNELLNRSITIEGLRERAKTEAAKFLG